MALIDCPECNTQVSSAAPSCPKCGFPVADAANEATGKGRFGEAASAAGVDLSAHEGPSPLPPLSEGESKSELRKQTDKRDWRLLAAIVTLIVVAAAIFNRCGRDAVEPVATVEPGSQSRGWVEGGNQSPGWTRAGKGLSPTPLEPGSQSRGWVEGGNRPSSKVGAVPVSAQGSIRNPEHTFGKNRATIQKLSERDDGTWIDGMCMLSRDMAVMFEWRNGRVMEHTILKEDTSFGHGMVRELRKLGGKEDSTVAAEGCDEYIWRNMGGRRYWVIICPSKGIATASARLLR